MKAGFENRGRVAIMVVLLLVAVYFVGRTFLGEAPSSPASSTRPQAKAKAAAKGPRACRYWWDCPQPNASLNPTLRTELLKLSEEKAYSGGRRNPFDMQSEPPPAPKVVATGPKCPGDPSCPPPPPVCPGPDPRCPPPPINLRFYGWASKPGEPRRIFLTSGEDIFMASEGEIVNRRYRVLRITPTTVEIEDVLNNNRQTIPLSPG